MSVGWFGSSPISGCPEEQRRKRERQEENETYIASDTTTMIPMPGALLRAKFATEVY